MNIYPWKHYPDQDIDHFQLSRRPLPIPAQLVFPKGSHYSDLYLHALVSYRWNHAVYDWHNLVHLWCRRTIREFFHHFEHHAVRLRLPQWGHHSEKVSLPHENSLSHWRLWDCATDLILQDKCPVSFDSFRDGVIMNYPLLTVLWQSTLFTVGRLIPYTLLSRGCATQPGESSFYCPGWLWQSFMCPSKVILSICK